MTDAILGFMIFAFIGIAMIAPIIALILRKFTNKSFQQGWKITSIVISIIILIMMTMVIIGETEGSLSLSYRYVLISFGIIVSTIFICLYLIIKKNFKKKWIKTSFYIIILFLLILVPILIMSSDLYLSVHWQYVASVFIIILIILLIIAPIIGFIIRQLKGDTFINGWKFSSIILTVILLLFASPVFIIQLTMETPKVEQLDQQYEEMKDDLPSDNSIDKILVDIYKDGNFRRDKILGRTQKSVSASANFILKNYNEEEFKGTITIQAILNGEKIGEKEIKIEALPNGEDSNTASAKQLNITKEIWDDVEFDYTIDGEFTRN